MASLTMPSDEDPLTAALPPTTDYITYLTILEYRLKPHNLNVLNGILDRDDGTLAKEIGWDLLRLVLPMLPDAPQDAAQCLDQIARRGNPREVVVRVAEELEKLGRLEDASDVGDEVDEGTEKDNLHTFDGEATRIHLGQMKLDGMPEAEPQAQQNDGRQPTEPAPTASDPALEAVQFHALLSILSTVHHRIKTQYPSRFLATSLPAALAAYRRMPITAEATIAFLQCLEKLSGKPRPALPPRQSTSDVASVKPTTASLPDPEAPAEASAGTNVASQLEKDIMARLLQAVLLEILDEFSVSWQNTDVPSMVWTRRLRERPGQGKVTGKTTAKDLAAAPPLSERDELMQRFTTLAKTLGLDPHEGVKPIKAEQLEEVAEDAQEEPSEYPTSPAQIPLSRTACLLLLAAEQYSQTVNSLALTFPDILSLFRSFTPLSDMPNVPNSSVQDALSSLLYGACLSSLADIANSPDSASFVELISILTQIFTTSPDPYSRDEAHHLAKTLFQARNDANDQITILKQTIRCSTSPSTNQPAITLATPFTEGALRAVGVNWLKDSILASLSTSTPTNESVPRGLPPTSLTTDRGLAELIWHPTIPAPTDTHLLPTVLLALPYYTALLNLSNVLVNRLPPEQQPSVGENVAGLLANLRPWRDELVRKLEMGDDDDGEVKASAPEIWALEDAVLRVGEALEAKKGGDGATAGEK